MAAAIRAVTERRDLAGAEMEQAMRTIMTGGATPAQIGGFLIGLRMKGETVEEIAAAARVMRELATGVSVRGPHLVDTCGTGGDGVHTFNISTTAAFVAAAAGARVAKHGNRSVSSKSGSADVLEAAGVKLDLSPEQVAQCIDQVGVGFMFAPRYHGAMRNAIGPRREMGVRTIFNLLGPLTNPAGAPNQVLGVFSRDRIEPLARVLTLLGAEHVLVVHADDGLDEISIGTSTQVAEIKDGEIRSYSLVPEQFGFVRGDVAELAVDSVSESLAMMRSALDDVPGPARDVALLNGAAAIYAAGVATSFPEAVERARVAVRSGAARARLEALVEFSRSV
jgi:anthranilate phosphoribosyltransferase